MPNPQKSQLKMHMATEIGADIEDAFEREIKAAHQLEGATEALKQAAIKINTDLAARVDQELEEGQTFKENMTSLQMVELVKKYIARCATYLAHMSANEAKKATEQLWRAQGLKDAMALVDKTRKVESEKMQQALAVVDEGGPRPVAQANAARAAHGTAAERRAAAKAEKDKPAKKKAARKPRKKAAKKANG